MPRNAPTKRALATSVLFLITLVAGDIACAKERLPNFIFVLSDDIAQGDIGVYGQELIKTPNLDRMAAEGTRYQQAYCGTAVYNAEFSVDPKLIKSGNPHWLNLGEVNISAAVKLNGVDLGVVWCSPWQVDVSKAVKPGANQLTIEVVNLWPNRLIGDGKLPEAQRRTKTNISHYYREPRKGKHVLLPSGLRGPVTLRHQLPH